MSLSSFLLLLAYLLIIRLSKPADPERASFPKVGTKFRYAGRTQQQVSGAPGLDRPAPFINRGANTRFLTLGRSGTLDTSSK